MVKFLRFSLVIGVVFGAAVESQGGPTLCCLTLAAALPGKVYFPGQNVYADSLGSYYSGQEGDIRPSCIVRPGSTVQVSNAVRILSAAHVVSPGSCKFAVRGGGHTPYAGAANIEAGVTIDLRGLNQVVVNKAQGSTSIGPGALWGEVYAKLDPLRLSVVGGRSNLVGVAGLTTGGGISFFSGRYGLVCDNTLNYEVVLADGRIVNANERENVDLRNALRGGSNNFGIVTRFDLMTFTQGDIWGGDILYDFSTVPRQLQAFVNFGNNAQYDEYSAFFQVFGTQDGFFFVLNNPIYTKPTPYPSTFKEFFDIQPQLSSTVRIAPLHNLTTITSSAAATGLRNAFITTSFANDLSFLQWLIPTWQTFTKTIDTVDGLSNTLLNQYLVPKVLSKAAPRGGNSLGLDPSKPVVVALLSLTWNNAADDGRVMTAATAFMDSVEQEAKRRQVHNPFVYLNYANRGQNVMEGYGSTNRAKLKATSRKYDPAGVFQNAVPGGFKL